MDNPDNNREPLYKLFFSSLCSVPCKHCKKLLGNHYKGTKCYADKDITYK